MLSGSPRPLAAVIMGALITVVALAAPGYAQPAEGFLLPGGPTSATDLAPVQIDTSLFLPDVTPAPAVLLAHGFGGSKAGGVVMVAGIVGMAVAAARRASGRGI